MTQAEGGLSDIEVSAQIASQVTRLNELFADAATRGIEVQVDVDGIAMMGNLVVRPLLRVRLARILS